MACALFSRSHLGDFPRDGGADELGALVGAHLAPLRIIANLQSEKQRDPKGITAVLGGKGYKFFVGEIGDIPWEKTVIYLFF